MKQAQGRIAAGLADQRRRIRVRDQQRHVLRRFASRRVAADADGRPVDATAVWPSGDRVALPAPQSSARRGRRRRRTRRSRAFNNVLSARPCCIDCGGLGVRMTATKDGLNLKISVVFKLQQPRFASMPASTSRICHAEIVLTGGAGFDDDASRGRPIRISRRTSIRLARIPVDLVLPLAFGGVPLELHYHQDSQPRDRLQREDVDPQVARAASRCTGNLGFVYQGGHFDAAGTCSSSGNSSLVGDVNGISVGINSVVVGDQSASARRPRASAGFAVGPYVGLTSTLTALKQATSAASMMLTQQGVADCRQATFQCRSTAASATRFPSPSRAVINFFLKLVHARPIAANGSFARLTPANLFDPVRSSMPPFCAGK